MTNSSGPIVEGLFVFMICWHKPLRAKPFLYDLHEFNSSPTSMIYTYTLEKVKRCVSQLIS